MIAELDRQAGRMAIAADVLRSLRPVATVHEVSAVPAPTNGRKAKALPAPKATPKGKRPSRSTLTEAQLAKAKQLWVDGEMPATEISARFGKSKAWCGVVASLHKWPKRGTAAKRKPAAPAAEGRPRYRCDDCGQSGYDPKRCDFCMEPRT